MTKHINSLALAGALALAVSGGSAFAAGFVNGGFEDGNTNGWTMGGGYRGSVTNANLNPANFLPGDGGTRSAVISSGYVDPRVGAALGSTVYSGSHSLRVEDTNIGGYASVATQTVTNYTDANIFFAWKAVLEGAHGTNDAATMIITLTDLTDGVEIIRREYNAASGGGGVDPRFSFNGDSYYTADWQIEQLAIDASLSGHDFVLSVLAADCQPTGHWGYVYLDGFGAVIPPQGVPEPASMALFGAGLLGLAAIRRRRNAA